MFGVLMTFSLVCFNNVPYSIQYLQILNNSRFSNIRFTLINQIIVQKKRKKWQIIVLKR